MMRVIDTRSDGNEVWFGDLDIGDVFEWCGCVLLKISDDDLGNALYLTGGEGEAVATVESSDLTVALKTELRILGPVEISP